MTRMTILFPGVCVKQKTTTNVMVFLVHRAGFGPATKRLRVSCSTAELPMQIKLSKSAAFSCFGKKSFRVVVPTPHDFFPPALRNPSNFESFITDANFDLR